MTDAWSFRIPAQPSDRLCCPYCDGNGHRCDHCDGNGWLLAEDAPTRNDEPRIEWNPSHAG